MLLSTRGPIPILRVRAATAASTVPASKHGPDGSDVHALGRLNDELLARIDFGREEEAVVPGWNGELVHVWIHYPPGFDPAKKWPLLHVIHGGPHTAALDQFHNRWNTHLFASRGYVTVSVNYHGSTGWGQDFADSILRHVLSNDITPFAR